MNIALTAYNYYIYIKAGHIRCENKFETKSVLSFPISDNQKNIYKFTKILTFKYNARTLSFTTSKLVHSACSKLMNLFLCYCSVIITNIHYHLIAPLLQSIILQIRERPMIEEIYLALGNCS